MATVAILLGCIAAYIISQAIKNLLDFVRGVWSPHSILASGGMPSSHAATVSALATGLFLNEGLSSAFAVSLVLLAIVAADARGVRHRLGELSATVNRFHKTNHETRIGHTSLEVISGILLGLVLGWVAWLL